MKFLVTGSAGFIGFHVSNSLLEESHTVIGLDNHNSYYSRALKEDRASLLRSKNNYIHYKMDLLENKELDKLFKEHQFDAVIHLAAQAGVRYSLENPRAYIESNLVGFFNILECCKENNLKQSENS